LTAVAEVGVRAQLCWEKYSAAEFSGTVCCVANAVKKAASIVAAFTFDTFTNSGENFKAVTEQYYLLT
jgi:hypothetical protein